MSISSAAAPRITLQLLLGALIAGVLLLFPPYYYLFRIFKGKLFLRHFSTREAAPNNTMILSIQLNNRTHKIDADNRLDIAIPLNFGSEQPNAYGVEKASSIACEAGTIIGDTRRGGSCNFEQIKLIPHCNGTHTECIGHITDERISVQDCLKDAFIPAILVSIEPEKASATSETYAIALNENDLLITREKLVDAISKSANENAANDFRQALIIRTLPNDDSKLNRTYSSEIPPFFSTEAMQYMREMNVRHLLVDTPSIDRIYDEGKLSNHRIFWNIGQGSFETNDASRINNTVTELIYVPGEIKDGAYLLNLQIAPFIADAAPSRPLLFRVY